MMSYETDPALTVFVGILSLFGLFLVLASLIYSCFGCIKKIGRRTYRVAEAEFRYGTKDNNEGWTYESFSRNELPLTEQPKEPENQDDRNKTRTKVMITDETGNIPQYTLRSRPREGSVASYTTYYNFNVRETEV
jgi:hypothetical protein